MEILSDISASSALVHATIEVETLHGGSCILGDWQSMLAELIISPSTIPAREYHGSEYELPRRKYVNTSSVL